MSNIAENLRKLDSKERSSFRARKSHWIKKGLSPEKATELAFNSSRRNTLKSLALDASASVTQAQVGEGVSANYPKAQVVAASVAQAQTDASANRLQVQARVSSSDDKVQAQVAASANMAQAQMAEAASAKYRAQFDQYEPSKKEVHEVVRKLKSVGLMREIRADAGSSYTFPDTKSEAILPIFEMVVSFFIVCGASSLLIASTLEVFGASWQGWTKALLLEFGIISLYLFKPAGRFEWIMSKGAFVFFLALSFAVLRSGVETVKASHTGQFEHNDRSINDLLSVRKEILSSLTALPPSYVSKRQPLLDQIKDFDAQIEKKRAALNGTAVAMALSSRATSEILMRAALILLNLIFSHRAFRLMDEICGEFGLQNRRSVNI